MAGIQDPASIEAQMQDRTPPLADPLAQGLRTRAEYFATAEGAPERLRAWMALAATEHVDGLVATGSIPNDEVAGGTALTIVLQGIGSRLAEHVTTEVPAIPDSTVRLDLGAPEPHRAAAHVARDLFNTEPGAWFEPGPRSGRSSATRRG